MSRPRSLAAKIDREVLTSVPILAGFRIIPYSALTRFGRWDQMLKEPEPPVGHAVMRAAWHYARGLSLVATGRADEAEAELTRVTQLLADESMKQPLLSPNIAAAPEVLAGEIAAARGDFDRALAHLERAVRLEDSLVYTEPSEFHFPPRHAPGAILLEAGRPAGAETIYWEDLRRNRDNGWALFGLVQALRAQDKAANAALVEAHGSRKRGRGRT